MNGVGDTHFSREVRLASLSLVAILAVVSSSACVPSVKNSLAFQSDQATEIVPLNLEVRTKVESFSISDPDQPSKRISIDGESISDSLRYSLTEICQAGRGFLCDDMRPADAVLSLTGRVRIDPRFSVWAMMPLAFLVGAPSGYANVEVELDALIISPFGEVLAKDYAQTSTTNYRGLYYHGQDGLERAAGEAVKQILLRFAADSKMILARSRGDRPPLAQLSGYPQRERARERSRSVLAANHAAQSSPSLRLAVLEFRGPFEMQVLVALADAARAGAVGSLSSQFAIMTRESMDSMLQDMGRSDRCVEGACEVETARNIGADLLVTGEVIRFDGTYLATLKLHETLKGSLLGTGRVAGRTPLELLDGVQAAATRLLEPLGDPRR